MHTTLILGLLHTTLTMACCTLARCSPVASRRAARFSSWRSRPLLPSAASHRARTACTSACSCARVASTRTAAYRAARCAAASSPSSSALCARSARSASSARSSCPSKVHRARSAHAASAQSAGLRSGVRSGVHSPSCKKALGVGLQALGLALNNLPSTTTIRPNRTPDDASTSRRIPPISYI